MAEKAKQLHINLRMSLEELGSRFNEIKQEGWGHILVTFRNGSVGLIRVAAGDTRPPREIAGQTFLFGLDTALDFHDQVERLPSDLKFL